MSLYYTVVELQIIALCAVFYVTESVNLIIALFVFAKYCENKLYDLLFYSIIFLLEIYEHSLISEIVANYLF